MIDDLNYLEVFGLGSGPIPARALWQHLVETQIETRPKRAEAGPALRLILEEGCLARRVIRASGPSPSRGRLREVYRRLAACLLRNETFLGEP